jgi:beta-glucanase (GH16 family)
LERRDWQIGRLAGWGSGLTSRSATGQLPDIGPFQLIDKDTPTSAYSYTSMETGDTWELVFSDEFNNDGRTFYGGTR